jgi:hypothetical protein
MPRRARTRIHVNQHVIKANDRHGTRDPVLTVKSGRSNVYAHTAIIRDDAGREVARVVYRPDRPLDCGARCWVETNLQVEPDGIPFSETDADR